MRLRCRRLIDGEAVPRGGLDPKIKSLLPMINQGQSQLVDGVVVLGTGLDTKVKSLVTK